MIISAKVHNIESLTSSLLLLLNGFRPSSTSFSSTLNGPDSVYGNLMRFRRTSLANASNEGAVYLHGSCSLESLGYRFKGPDAARNQEGVGAPAADYGGFFAYSLPRNFTLSPFFFFFVKIFENKTSVSKNLTVARYFFYYYYCYQHRWFGFVIMVITILLLQVGVLPFQLWNIHIINDDINDYGNHYQE